MVLDLKACTDSWSINAFKWSFEYTVSRTSNTLHRLWLDAFTLETQNQIDGHTEERRTVNN
jgi:hypothetical protein